MKPSKNTKKLMGLDTPTAATPERPKYDSGVKYDSDAHYATGDPTPLPVDDGGVVKFSSTNMTDSQITEFAGKENAAITGNEGFSDPQPPVADVAAANADLQAKMEAMALAQDAAKQATNARNVARAYLDSLMKTRANYVQFASNGNTDLILSAGFPVRSPRTPTGDLTPPQNLRIDLNGTPGVMFLRWDPVYKARAYNIQISPADTTERNWTPYETTTVARYKCDGMALGSTYAFRIAAVGGASGQSDWSAEVVRMAA